MPDASFPFIESTVEPRDKDAQHVSDHDTLLCPYDCLVCRTANFNWQFFRVDSCQITLRKPRECGRSRPSRGHHSSSPPCDNRVVNGVVQSRAVMGILRGSDDQLLQPGEPVRIITVDSSSDARYDILRLTVTTSNRRSCPHSVCPAFRFGRFAI